MKKKILALVATGLIGAMALTGCGSDNSEIGNANGETVTVTHASGETEAPVDPERVAVFDMAAIDTINTLGLGDKIVAGPAVTFDERLAEFDPTTNDDIEAAGTMHEPDLEAVFNAEPDLIIIGGRAGDFYDDLSEIAPTISVSRDSEIYMESATEILENMGKIFDKEDEVAASLDELNEKIDVVRDEVTAEGYTATFLMANEGSLSVFGEDSRFGILFQDLGFTAIDEEVVEETHGQSVSFEYLAEQGGDFLFVVDRAMLSGDGEDVETAAQTLDNDIMNNSEAYKNDRIVYLPIADWYTIDGGLSALHRMVDQVADAVEAGR